MNAKQNILALALALLAAGTPAFAQNAPPPDAEVAGAPVRPWPGTFAEGMAELARLVEDGRHADALALADRILEPTAAARLRARLERVTGGISEKALAPLQAPLEWLGIEPLSAADRGRVHYAKALARASGGTLEGALEDFELARVLAPGETRLAATYNLGTLDLLAGDALRSLIPELAGGAGPGAAPPGPAPGPPLPGGPGGPGGPGSPAGSGQDPLELARKAYLAARERFVERLRLDWTDADTRANVELVVRRLRELDEIERQREEQEKRDQDQEQQDEQNDNPEQQGEDEESKPEDAGAQQDQPPPDDAQDEQPPDEEQQREEQAQEQEQSESSEEGEDQSDPRAMQEQRLTEEEMKRLLQILAEHEKEGEEVRAQLLGARRMKVKRDW